MSSTLDRINAIASKLRSAQATIVTEEATKNALVMPFISQVLGYDVFDPAEVVPEFIADVGTKKGEKIDYAILRDGAIQILVECKKISEPLDINHASQLFRYFSVTSARIAILTNGREYQVFTDGDRANLMDSTPFLVFDILGMDRLLVPEVAKLSKESFDLDSIVSAAEELKYIGQIKRLIAGEIKNPSDAWVRFFTTRVYERNATQRVVEQFRVLVAKAFAQYIADQVSDRLNTALSDNDGSVTAAPAEATPAAPTTVQNSVGPNKDDGIDTTEEELDGFNIVRAILARAVDPARVSYRDGKVYFAILLHDNNRKPIVRLYLSGRRVKFITTFENGKYGERHEIGSVIDLYQHIDRLLATIDNYA
ncbi:type I restriction endonuclease [Nocardia iowensis]|uniref:Type I restriction enzyme HsdR N-terminal domain-containing protein n=1 Tax=Nocardia iowensis TaxID=204891 RepID=A0ABX8RSJ8_NOCIO|nr:type I restriction endonuclease [Nocardia iowensis]QXN91862.1 type I restriction enzyme HsdR N-terminal domain-containing protein [Nocardia iowensis]